MARTDGMSDEWCAHGPSMHCKDCEIERLDALVVESCTALKQAGFEIERLEGERDSLVAANQTMLLMGAKSQEQIVRLEGRLTKVQRLSRQRNETNNAMADEIERKDAAITRALFFLGGLTVNPWKAAEILREEVENDA